MSKHARLARAGAALLATSLVVVGCGSGGDEPQGGTSGEPVSAEWQAVIDAAKQEGHVTWYSVAPAGVRDALKEGFEKKYGITVEIRTISTAEMNAALEAEHDTGVDGADVVTSVGYGWIQEKAAAGWFVDLSNVPSLQAPEWTASGYLVDDLYITAPLGLLVLAWNTTLFDGEINTYDDLLDPKLAGGVIGTVRPEPSLHADHWAFIEENFNENWLTEFAKQDPAIYPSAFANQEALAAGEIAVSAFVSATDILALQEQGAPLDFRVPSPVWAAQNVFFVPESSHRKNAALLFIDYFASEEGQRAAAKYGYSPLESVAPETLGGQSEVVLTNLERALDPNWHADYLAAWRELYE